MQWEIAGILDDQDAVVGHSSGSAASAAPAGSRHNVRPPTWPKARFNLVLRIEPSRSLLRQLRFGGLDRPNIRMHRLREKLLRRTTAVRLGSKPECLPNARSQLPPAGDIRRIGSGPLRANSRPEQVQQTEQAYSITSSASNCSEGARRDRGRRRS
jgi:hypothetical protein